MSELVERLRALVIMDEVRSNNPLGREAADRIEALEAALREIKELGEDGVSAARLSNIARAALEQDK